MKDAELKKKLKQAEYRAEFSEDLVGEISKLAWRDKLQYKHKLALLKILIICLTIALCVALFSAVHTIKHAIDRNYEYLESLVIETETYEISADSDGYGNANAIYGDENIVAGGDISGKGKN